MPKLHEVLAAESTLASQADKCRTDLEGTFSGKRHLFEETLVTFYPNDESKPPVTEKQSVLQTIVLKELDWIKGIWSPTVDSGFQIDHANTLAKADIVLEDANGTPGKVIASGVPATALLRLEHFLNALHVFVGKIPTLDPAKGFAPDPLRERGVYQSKEETRPRTQKEQKPIVLYPATPEHPAQTQLLSLDVEIGRVVSKSWAGMLSVAEKGEMLERCEALRVAVKKARARANEQAVDTTKKIGHTLFDFVFKG